jgi:hypothetical protein
MGDLVGMDAIVACQFGVGLLVLERFEDHLRLKCVVVPLSVICHAVLFSFLELFHSERGEIVHLKGVPRLWG